jgi:hypothetical protein
VAQKYCRTCHHLQSYDEFALDEPSSADPSKRKIGQYCATCRRTEEARRAGDTSYLKPGYSQIAYEPWDDHPSDRAMRLARGSTAAEGWVYALTERDSYRYIKIGWSKENPDDRVKSCQTGNPRELVLIDRLEGSRELERAVHDCLGVQGHHVRGEWFTNIYRGARPFDWLRRARDGECPISAMK